MFKILPTTPYVMCLKLVQPARIGCESADRQLDDSAACKLMRGSILALVVLTAGCGSSGTEPSRVSTTTTTTPVEIRPAVFSDPNSSFSTSDVRESQRRIVRFDTATNSLIWAADGRTFPGYPVSGNFISSRQFQVAFGTEGGERRAYFTETASGTICDIEVNSNGVLLITGTSERVPGN